MMRILKKNLLLVLLMICPTFLLAQQVNTLYFMENLPSRNMYNPAFQPINDIYVSLPIIGYMQMSVGNNSVALKDLMYKKDDGFVTSLYDIETKQKLYNKILPTFLMNANLQVNLLTIGFRKNSSFWTFSVNEKIDASFTVPKDAFKLGLFGVDDLPDATLHQTYSVSPVNYNLSGLKVNMTAYTEFGLGCARDINDAWSVGAKVKFLYGNMNISNVNQFTNLTWAPHQITVNSIGSINTSVPFPVAFAPTLLPVSVDTAKMSNPMSYLPPTGLGGGLDLGVDYWATNELSFSLAAIDLGFISWNKANSVNYDATYMYDGVNQQGVDKGVVSLLSTVNQSTLSDSLLAGLKSNQKISNKSYTTFTTAKLNAGVEYKMFNNYLSLGLLSRTYFGNINVSEEITASANYRPLDWFNASLSYSFFNGNFSNIGFGVGLQTWIFHWFLAADYIPTYLYKMGGLPIIPAGTGTFNLALGMNLVFNYPSAESIAAKNKQKMDDRFGCPSCDDRIPSKNIKKRSKAYSKKQEIPTYSRKTEPIVGPMYGR